MNRIPTAMISTMSPPTTPAAMTGMMLLVLEGGSVGGGGLIVGRVYLEGVREYSSQQLTAHVLLC